MLKRINDAIEGVWPWWRHPRSMRFMSRFEFDWWKWGLGLSLYLDLAPGFHFDKALASLMFGPAVVWFGIVDTN